MNEKFYLGIDIGGSKIRGVLWNGRRVVMATEVATPRTKRTFAKRIVALITGLSRRAKRQVRGTGIGVAGLIRGRRVMRSRNIPYLRNFDFTALRLPPPIRVGNDAEAFGRAESELGAGRRARRVLAFTIGTGIGRAYVELGRVRVVKKFEHAEPWEPDYQRIRDGGDSRTLAAFIGEKLARIARQYRVDMIVLGGGVLGRRGFTKRLISDLRGQGLKAKVRRGNLGRNAAAIGAALLFSP